MSWISILFFVYLLHGNVKAFFANDNKLKNFNLITAFIMVIVFLIEYFKL